VDQGGSVKRLARLLAGEVPRGQAAQLVVDQWQQLGGGLRVALLDGVEEYRSSVNTVAFNANPVLGHCRSEYFLGNIAELLIYDGALSQSDRKALETYLGQKYALVPPPSVPINLIAFAISPTQMSLMWQYPTTNDSTEFAIERKTPGGTFAEVLVGAGRSLIDTTVSGGASYIYRVRARNYSGTSDPSNEASAMVPVSGISIPLTPIRLWLKADHATNPVSNWLDESARNNNAFQAFASQQPLLISNALNGRPVVHFSGGEYFRLPNFMNAATEGEIFMVVRSGGIGNHRLADFGASQYGSVYPWSDGLLYDDFGSTVQYGLGYPPIDIGQYRIYNTSSKTNNWSVRFDGIERFHETTNTVGFNTNPLLGRCRSENFLGDIAEAIIFDRALTPGERDRVDVYLAAKYLLPDFDINEDGLTTAQDLALGLDPYHRPDANSDGIFNGLDQQLGIDPNGNGYPWPIPPGSPPIPLNFSLSDPPGAVLIQ